MKYSIERSEITERTEQINKFALLVDLFYKNAVVKETFTEELSKIEQIEWSKENLFNQLIGYSVLGDAYGILKSRELDFRKAYYTNEYVYKEVSYYHNVQYLISRVKREEWAALYLTAFRTSCRAYLCLANAYDHLGRLCEAQQYYRMALLDTRNTQEVEINQGFAYANMHAFWTEEEPFIVRKAQRIIKKYQQIFDGQSPYFRQICSWPSPSFDAPIIDYANIQDGEYEKWVCQHYLRINRFNDVEPDSMLSLYDNVKLQVILDTPEKKALYESSFEEIKGSFISARKMLYTIINDDEKCAEWKAIMEGMSFNAFMVFHSKMNELMKTKKATLVKYGFLTPQMQVDHKRYWAGSYYWHNKEYDEQEYMTYRKQTEIIVTIFYEGILRGTQYGNHPRTKYALKIHSIIEELMNRDWSKVNNNIK